MLATLLSTLHAKGHTNRLLGGQSAMLTSKILTLQDTGSIEKRSEKSESFRRSLECLFRFVRHDDATLAPTRMDNDSHLMHRVARTSESSLIIQLN